MNFYFVTKSIAMKTVEIKKKLIDQINISDNKDLLKEFYQYLNRENELQEPYKLTEDQNYAIEEARVQIKRGDYSTNEQVDEEIEEWLKK